MNQTFQNSAQVISIGVFFTLLIAGLSATLPHAIESGLCAQGAAAATAAHAAQLPPISVLFAAFLGYNPIQHLLGAHGLAGLSAHDHALLTGRSFFPHLIAGPFRNGLHEAFAFAIVACLMDVQEEIVARFGDEAVLEPIRRRPVPPAATECRLRAREIDMAEWERRLAG
jgi:hypothetical protein